MTTNTNTKQTRQIDTSVSSTDDESNQETETEITLPKELKQDSDGRYLCPVDGCEFTGEVAGGLPQHYFYAHDTTITADLFGEETWREYLQQEHIEKGNRPAEIASAFDGHIGSTRVREDLEKYGFYFKQVGNIPESACILLRSDVSTIADAQRVAAKKRGEL